MKYSVIILCGGLGTRISKIPDIKVKILAPIGSKVFFDYFIKWLELSSCYTEDLILAMGFNSDVINNYIRERNIDIKKSIEKFQKGTLPAVIQACSKAKYDDILVLNGDTIFDISFKEMYDDFSKEKGNPILSLKAIEKDSFEKGYILLKDNTLQFVNNTPQFISCGAFFTTKNSINKVFNYQQIINNDEKYDLDIHYLTSHKSRKFICGENYMIDIGTIENYYKSQNLIPKIISF